MYDVGLGVSYVTSMSHSRLHVTVGLLSRLPRAPTAQFWQSDVEDWPLPALTPI